MPSTAGVCGYKLPVAAAGYVSVGPALALLDLPPLPSTPLPLDVPVLEVMLLALPEFSMLSIYISPKQDSMLHIVTPATSPVIELKWGVNFKKTLITTLKIQLQDRCSLKLLAMYRW